MLDLSGDNALLFNPANFLAILRAALLLGLPALPLLRHIGREWSAPERAAIGLGVLAAPLLLVSVAIDHFSPRDVFATGGPWDLGFDDFVQQRLLPLLPAPLDLARTLAKSDSPDLKRGAAILGAAILVVVGWPLRRGRRRAELTAAARRLFLVLWSSYATVYLLSVVAWAANRLNFWCFLVLLLASLLVREE